MDSFWVWHACSKCYCTFHIAIYSSNLSNERKDRWGERAHDTQWKCLTTVVDNDDNAVLAALYS